MKFPWEDHSHGKTIPMEMDIPIRIPMGMDIPMGILMGMEIKIPKMKLP